MFQLVVIDRHRRWMWAILGVLVAAQCYPVIELAAALALLVMIFGPVFALILLQASWLHVVDVFLTRKPWCQEGLRGVAENGHVVFPVRKVA